MRWIVTAGKYGMEVKQGRLAESLVSLQMLLLIEKAEPRKLRGYRVEAIKIRCHVGERKRLEKRMRNIVGWIILVPIDQLNALAFLPCQFIFDKKYESKTLSPENAVAYLKRL